MMKIVFPDTKHVLLKEESPELPVVYLVTDRSDRSILIKVEPTKHSLPTIEGKDQSTIYAPLDNEYFKEFPMEGHELVFSALLLGKCDLNTFISKYNLDECLVGINISVSDNTSGVEEDIIIFNSVLPFDTFKISGNTDYIVFNTDAHKHIRDHMSERVLEKIPFFVNMHKLRMDKFEYETALREQQASARNQGFIRLP